MLRFRRRCEEKEYLLQPCMVDFSAMLQLQKWIQCLHASAFKILDVAGHDGQAMN